jgi:cyclophilin family peptidyl-prolyl cis-trans isomerase
MKVLILPKFIVFALILPLFSCTKKEQKKGSEIQPKKVIESVTAQAMKVNADGLSKARAIIKTAHGNISFHFYPKHAPNTVSRVIQLIKEGFYDGLKFHRVIENFIIQTGDPSNKGYGGSGRKLKAELSDLHHIKGTVAMARSLSNLDSADSQFYIALKTLPDLDKKYTVFGQVIEGIELLDKIKLNDRIISIEVIE